MLSLALILCSFLLPSGLDDPLDDGAAVYLSSLICSLWPHFSKLGLQIGTSNSLGLTFPLCLGFFVLCCDDSKCDTRTTFSFLGVLLLYVGHLIVKLWSHFSQD